MRRFISLFVPSMAAFFLLALGADGEPQGASRVGNLDRTNLAGAGLADFNLECAFCFNDLKHSEFNLEISDSAAAAIVRLNWQSDNGWVSQVASNGSVSGQRITGFASVREDTWYRFRFVGRAWGEANAHYDLYLSATNLPTVCVTNLTGFMRPAGAVPRGCQYAFMPATTGVELDSISSSQITPYTGPVAVGVDTKTLIGKVMCGYQGWFGAPGDGRSQSDWRHWTKHYGPPLEDGNAKVDLWPDVSQLEASERFATGFKMPDGSPADVFSSFRKPTVLKHFEWMQRYGIDGVFVQRFANGVRDAASLEHCNTVLANCREGANRFGRTYAVMYDLSGLRAGHIEDVMNDWRMLREQMVITGDPAYLNHRGKPVVAVWGIGFNDHRDYTLAECRRLIQFLKNDPEVGGCTVMLGVPTNWRKLEKDAVSDPALLDIISMADIVSPWTVGRYSDPAGAAAYAENILKPDQAWCHQRGIDFLPVVFPGFSWHNMTGGPSDQIPRRRGQFLWSQFNADRQASASMLYVAMFDEVDEGTAIFMCANKVPIGQKSKFITYDGLPGDFYLKMVGAGTKLFRSEASPENKLSLSDH